MKKLFHRNKDKELHEAFSTALKNQPVVFQDVVLAKENNVLQCLFPDADFHKQFVDALHEIVTQLTAHGVEFMLIKTEKRYPYTDSNIDILCKTDTDFQKARDIAKQNGRTRTKSYHEPDKEMWRLMKDGSEQRHPLREHKHPLREHKHPLREHKHPLREHKPGWHLHPAVSWNGVPYLQNSELFGRARTVRWEGVEFLVPSLEHDILIHAAHTVFENFQITLGEFYDASERVKATIDWKYVYQQAENNGWLFGLKLFLSALTVYADLVKKPCVLPEDLDPWPRKLRFPIRYPMIFQLWAFSERIFFNLRHGRLSAAVRECYAYPAFYLIEKFKHTTRIQYP